MKCSKPRLTGVHQSNHPQPSILAGARCAHAIRVTALWRSSPSPIIPMRPMRPCSRPPISVYSAAMNLSRTLLGRILMTVAIAHASAVASELPPAIPRFSLEHMDRSVDPGADFYRFAAGTWLKNNPVPSDKSRWSGFEQLRERNWHLLHELLDSSSDQKMPRDVLRQKVGDFYASAMDTQRLEQLRFKPLERDLKRIEGLKSTKALFA